MPNRLVIVESPTKAATISRFLDDSYVVESSYGHIRDLPSNSTEIPAAYKSEPWARLGIDVNNDFKPLYVISKKGKKRVGELRKLAAAADELYLATDEDREGEAISWHLLEVLSPPDRVQVHRMVFHEITREAIAESLRNLRDIDRRLVDAQEARRLLDRLYGFEVSPVLWKKVAAGLSAGRVQSVATRMVVERERERMAFVPASYWSLHMVALPQEDGGAPSPTEASFKVRMSSLDGVKIAQGKDFDADGKSKSSGLIVLSESEALRLGEDLNGNSGEVSSVREKPYKRKPPPPFITSTLQQEAGRRLGLSSKVVMQLAQSLYEKGYITYMRTDSTTLSASAVTAVRKEISRRFGEDYLPSQPRRHHGKARNAQEAHEAVRPAGERLRHPDELRGRLNAAEARLYDLIWRRTMASQMTDAVGKTVSVEISARSSRGEKAVFFTSGTIISHEGFRAALPTESKKTAAEGGAGRGAAIDAEEVSENQVLPKVSEGDVVRLSSPEPAGHETKPPARFTEATLVRKLEELGVGRPSTYASIMGTIQDRGYVWKKGSALIPAFTAFVVVSLLEKHFGDLVDYAFTARMEDDLDKIANGSNESIPWLRNFYFGASDAPGLKTLVSERLDDIDPRAINSIPVGVDSDGTPIEIRLGRYGPFLSCGERRADLRDDLPPDELTVERALELLEASRATRELGADPESGLPVTAKAGRYGPFVQLGPAPGDEETKPLYASLFKSMTLETVTLSEALKLLSLPRTLGSDDAGEAVTAQNGRYGPYVKKGKETRSLETEEQLFTVTLDEALELLSRPKTRRGSAARGPLRELGSDPLTGKEVVLREGRFGPYVSDGEINASLRKADDPEKLSIGRASELLAERRSSGGKPSSGGRSRSSASAKTKANSRSNSRSASSRPTRSKSSSPQSSRKTKRSGPGRSSGRPR